MGIIKNQENQKNQKRQKQTNKNQKQPNKNRKYSWFAVRVNMALRTAGLIFAISFSLQLILGCILMLADSHGLLESEDQALVFMGVAMIIACIFMGFIISSVMYKLVMVPMRNMINGFSELGRGNFDVRLVSDNRSEIGFLTDSFNQMAEMLGGLELMRNDFIANVSHEFKTPIASIQGCAALLQDDSLSEEECKQHAQQIYNSAKRLSVLSSNILELSKLENADVRVEKTRYQLDEQLREALLELENKWQEKDIELDIDLPETYYTGSRELLMQVWVNLLGNAIKFSEPGGRVGVKLEPLSSAVAVTISDEGIGISPEVQKRIFDKFYQGDTSHKTEGNGLGLAMVKRILELLGAGIEVESEPGHGAAFTVILPVMK